MKRGMVRSVYVRLRRGKYHHTCEILPEVFLDSDRNGRPLGIEFPSALDIRVSEAMLDSRPARHDTGGKQP